MADLAKTVHTDALPGHIRGMVRQWHNSQVEPRNAATMVKLHASAAAEGIRGTGEAVVIGSVLGAIHAMSPTGLDVKIPSSTAHLPVDAAIAVVGLIGGIGAVAAPHGTGKTLANAGQTAAGIYAFRQTNDLIAKIKEKRAGATGGTNIHINKTQFGAESSWAPGTTSWASKPSSFRGEDPIVTAARNL